MAVLKHISPTQVPVAPKDSRSKNRPSSRAKSARISPSSMRSYCSIFKWLERDNIFFPRRIPRLRRFAHAWIAGLENHSFGKTGESKPKKENPNRGHDPGF